MITIPQHHRRTDGRTDRQTTCHGNTALRVASRGKNETEFWSDSRLEHSDSPKIISIRFVRFDSPTHGCNSGVRGREWAPWVRVGRAPSKNMGAPLPRARAATAPWQTAAAPSMGVPDCQSRVGLCRIVDLL